MNCSIATGNYLTRFTLGKRNKAFDITRNRNGYNRQRRTGSGVVSRLFKKCKLRVVRIQLTLIPESINFRLSVGWRGVHYGY